MTDQPTIPAVTMSDMQDIEDLISVAGTYAKDGAFCTAAERLRIAAERLDRLAAKTDAGRRYFLEADQ